jgi:hypothetical protein
MRFFVCIDLAACAKLSAISSETVFHFMRRSFIFNAIIHVRHILILISGFYLASFFFSRAPP